jgi:hypothetical protein
MITNDPRRPLLDALAVEAALNGRRPFDQLSTAEVDEVLRILDRRGATLDQAAALLDVDPIVLARRGTPVGWSE